MELFLELRLLRTEARSAAPQEPSEVVLPTISSQVFLWGAQVPGAGSPARGAQAWPLTLTPPAWCPFALAARGVRSWGYLCPPNAPTPTPSPPPHGCSFQALNGGWRVNPGHQVLPSQFPLLHPSQEAGAVPLLLSWDEKRMLHLRSLNGMLMKGGESVFIIHVPPPTSASFQGSGTPVGLPVTEQQVTAPPDWLHRGSAAGAALQPSCPGSPLLLVLSDWGHRAPGQPSWESEWPWWVSPARWLALRLWEWKPIPVFEKWLLTFRSKGNLCVSRRTLWVSSWVHCAHWLHLLITFAFLILTSVKGTGTKPNTYFPGHLLHGAHLF